MSKKDVDMNMESTHLTIPINNEPFNEIKSLIKCVAISSIFHWAMNMSIIFIEGVLIKNDKLIMLMRGDEWLGAVRR